MDKRMLCRIHEELDSSEVEALCFLCLDVVSRKRLNGVSTTYLVQLSQKPTSQDKGHIEQLHWTVFIGSHYNYIQHNHNFKKKMFL